MIMAGYEYQKELPFKNVYLTGIVRDKQGRKMSKSLGNSPDPITLIDKYGADGVRVGMLLCSPAGNDLPFDESLCEQGRNFANKIWNAFRLIKGWEVKEINQTEYSKIAINWFENKLNKEIENINKSYDQYRISEALMTTYKLIWDDFCAWYLETIKPEYSNPIDQITYEKTIYFLEILLKLLHPFTPFLTEEIWHFIRKREDDIIVSKWPEINKFDNQIIDNFSSISEVVTNIRKIRKEQNIPNKEVLELNILDNTKIEKSLDPVIQKLSNISKIKYVNEKQSNSLTFMVKSNQYFVPFSKKLDIDSEIEKLKKELEYTEGFLKIVENKLSNSKFIKNAPQQLVDNERNKQVDAKERIKILADKISALSNA
tara:strand:+ start:1 stop:1116 length:1116 start_codon:yes stop_codon:yes gene_type:complete